MTGKVYLSMIQIDCAIGVPKFSEIMTVEEVEKAGPWGEEMT